ncbi:MAG: glycerate kinase [Chloroflexi bacterium]|nr:glycerate kinase [Chloroflexota bacterium]
MAHTVRRSVIIAPGAFKHSLSAPAAAAAIERGLRRSGLHRRYDCHCMPIADGGNGTLEAFLSGDAGLQRLEVPVHDPFMRPIHSAIAVPGTAGDGPIVIEMALASGLELLRANELNPRKATTYGTGELMRAALDHWRGGEMIVGMGGSATVDGGAGCLQALGVRFYDREGHELPPGLAGGDLHRVHRVDAGGLDPRWKEVSLVIATDVDNPALGPSGAAAVFGPQKGADRVQVIFLEASLRHFFSVLADQLGVDVRTTPGSGAAGALSGGLMALFGERARIQSGIDLLLDASNFEERLAQCALVITGEGRMDEQTIHGKGPIGVARRAAAHGVRTVALVGGLDADDALLHEAGVWAAMPIVTGPMSLDEAIERAEVLVERAATRLGYLLQTMRRRASRV